MIRWLFLRNPTRCAAVSVVGVVLLTAAACTTSLPTSLPPPVVADDHKEVAGSENDQNHFKNTSVIFELDWPNVKPEGFTEQSYQAAKSGIEAYWRCYAAKEWGRCFELETSGVQQFFGKDRYELLWRTAPKIKKITLTGLEWISEGKIKARARLKIEKPAHFPVDMSDQVDLVYEWHRDDISGAWLRDYRDPLLRP